MAKTCIVLNENPLVTTPDGSIGVMDFYLLDHGDFGPGGPDQTGGQNLRFPRFDPMILCSFKPQFDEQH